MKNRKESLLKKMQNVTRVISDPMDPDYLRYNTFSLYITLLFVAVVASTILTAVQKQYTFLPYAIVMCFVGYFSRTIVQKKRMSTKMFRKVVFGLEVFLTLLGPLLYVSSGGIRSSVSIWFFLILIYTTVMFEGRWQVIFYFLQIIFYFIAVILDYFGLIEVTGQLSETSWYLSLFVSIAVVSGCVGTLIMAQINEYKQRQNELIDEIKEASRQREQAEEIMAQYEEQREIAEKALKTRSEFLKNMSHEVKTPLNAILGLADVIGRLNDVNEIHTLVGNITNAAKGLNIIISDILEYSAGGDVEVEINNSPYPSELLFNSFRNMCVPQLESKGVGYKIERDRLPAFLMGDITRIQQILFNLLSNAVKYTNEGTVTYKVLYSYSNEELMIIVSDTGIGIKEDNLKTIFDSFERIEAADTKHTEGIGLGLSLCKKIIDALGGKISCQSVYGEGTSFIVKIPQKPVDPALVQSKETTLHAKYDFSGKKILYVDNTQANHFALDRMLLDTGAYVGHSFSVKDVLELPDEKLRELDLVILDYVYQSMDAVHLLAHLREKGMICPALCAIGKNNLKEAEIVTKKGFEAIIEKPLVLEEVLKSISSVI